jgi:fumarate hydratase, class II
MSTEYRIETDTFGDLKVPANVYWGAQTQRLTDIDHCKKKHS